MMVPSVSVAGGDWLQKGEIKPKESFGESRISNKLLK
jgi:hypothetical protein